MTSLFSSSNAPSRVDEISAWRVELKTSSTTLEPSAAAEGLGLGIRLFTEGSDLVALFSVTAASSTQAAIAANSRWIDACCRIRGLRTEIDQLSMCRVGSRCSAAQRENVTS